MWLGPVLRVWAVLVWRALVPLVLAYDIAANATANLNHPTIRTIVPFTAVPFTAVPFTAVPYGCSLHGCSLHCATKHARARSTTQAAAGTSSLLPQ